MLMVWSPLNCLAFEFLGWQSCFLVCKYAFDGAFGSNFVQVGCIFCLVVALRYLRKRFFLLWKEDSDFHSLWCMDCRNGRCWRSRDDASRASCYLCSRELETLQRNCLVRAYYFRASHRQIDTGSVSIVALVAKFSVYLTQRVARIFVGVNFFSPEVVDYLEAVFGEGLWFAADRSTKLPRCNQAYLNPIPFSVRLALLVSGFFPKPNYVYTEYPLLFVWLIASVFGAGIPQIDLEL